ncbi:hypothetical protein BST81_19725 [Leptolyngbya sp. 'hensonii']|uniref:CCE_0567 family metalloprotein n=1 Tax=Leptolyngbya sp. 'hensonii' TaxID=1922337 RepID=UPI00094F82F0|nr:CCE_0567 family metalloprotein [Leptolyngbya sp. 'hensonii']OLP16669.1 hypothetical protein BST81_19725 [Leptolyngbya sp. 'hensonii']
MTPTLTPTELKTQIKRLNSKAGQMKMDLHDLAEGLPTDYERLMEVAGQTYEIFRQIDELKQQLARSEAPS